MRLIDADALKTIRSIQSANYNSIETIQHWIDNAPTIDAVPATIEGTLGYLHKVGWMQEHDRIMTEDAVPVVRCKDCTYYCPLDDSRPYDCLRSGMLCVRKEDFCSCGKERQ